MLPVAGQIRQLGVAAKENALKSIFKALSTR
jgi:hypothetical protein